jgi:hypothetical protein
MRQFDFYEFTGVLVPGTTLLAGAAVCSDPIKQVVFDEDLSIGTAALSVIVAYGLGHLVQALGNLIELFWWRVWGGIPSDWPRSKKHFLLSDEQTDSLGAQLVGRLRHKAADDFKASSAEDWRSVVREVYAAVAEQEKAHRVDVFNGNYGLNRGLAAALIAVAIVVLVTHGSSYWTVVVLLVAAAGIAMYRMHRFGVHYARELFVQFLRLPGTEASAGISKE